MSIAELAVRISADAAAFRKEVADMGPTMQKAAKVVAAAALAVGVAFGGMAAKGTQEFAAFQGSMNEVFTLLPGISGDAMADMSDQVKDFATDFKVLPEKVVPALYQAISAGVPQDNVFDFLEVAQKAAVGGVSDLTTAVDGISSVVNAYGADVISAAKASDLMFTAVKLGKTDFSQLSATLFNVIPTASALGVEFGDITAALAAMTAQGTPTSVATTQLRQLFVELSKAGGEAAKTFTEVAGVTFKEFVAQGGNVQGALQLMEGAAAEMNVGISDLFGSVEAGNAALALTGKGTETFAANLAQMADAAGATDAAYQQMDQGIGRAFEGIKAAMSVMWIDLGEKLAPAVQAFADWISAHMPEIQAFVEQAFSSMGTAMTFLSENVLPVLVLAFNGAQEAVQWIIDHWPTIEPIMQVVAGFIAAVMIPKWIALGVAATVNAAKNVAAWVSMQAAAVASSAQFYAHIAQMVVKWVFLGAQSLLHAAKVAAAWVIAAGPIAWIGAAVVALVALIIANWEEIKAFTVRNWDAISEYVVIAVRAIAAVLTFGMSEAVIAVVKNWNTIKTTILGAIDAVLGPIRGLMDTIGGALSKVKEFFGAKGSVESAAASMRIPDAADYVALPGFAAGGMVPGPIGAPMAAIVHGGERVLTPAQQRSGQGGSGGTVINVTIPGPVYGILDFEQKVKQTVRDAIQGGGFRGVIATP